MRSLRSALPPPAAVPRRAARSKQQHYVCRRSRHRGFSFDRELEPTEEPTEEERAALICSPLIGRGVGSFDAAEELAQDIAALRAKSAAAPPPTQQRGQPEWLERLNTSLVAVFFVVIFFGAWLLAGLLETRVLKTEALSTTWLQLWPVLIQPALGVLMAASLASGLAGWLREQGEAKRDAES